MADGVETRDDFETRADAGKGDRGLVRLWMSALATADKEEESWRKEAEGTVQRYRQEQTVYGFDTSVTGVDTFNILFASIETLVPALYNSVPVPDIRRRFGDDNEAAKLGSQMLERAISYLVDSYDFDHVMKTVVRDNELTGRGVTRVNWRPAGRAMRSDVDTGDDVDWETATCEHVPWANFRHGPGRMWSDVRWIAFELFKTREQLRELSRLGDEVKLDVQISEYDRAEPGEPPAEIFQRARVWEVWDKDTGQVLHIAPSMAEQPLKIEDDPLELIDFFPVPRPLYAIKTSDSLVPIPPYRMYAKQAQELSEVTQRIMKLIRCLKWRGVRDASIKEFDDLAKLEDGEFSPMQDTAALYTQAGGIEKAIWMMPIGELITTIRNLSMHREELKQAIFEITGVADIMRGQTDPNETMGAQRMKVQWGSLRIQDRQAEVARYARDLFRLKSEIIAAKFAPKTLMTMSGIPVPSEALRDMARQQLQAQQMMARQQAQGAPQGAPATNGARPQTSLPPMPPPQVPQRPPMATGGPSTGGPVQQGAY